MTGYTDSTAQHTDPGPAIDELIAIDGDIPRPTIGRPVDRPTRCGSRRTLAVFEMTALNNEATRILRRPNGVIRDNLHAPTRRTSPIDRQPCEHDTKCFHCDDGRRGGGPNLDLWLATLSESARDADKSKAPLPNTNAPRSSPRVSPG